MVNKEEILAQVPHYILVLVACFSKDDMLVDNVGNQSLLSVYHKQNTHWIFVSHTHTHARTHNKYKQHKYLVNAGTQAITII